MVYSFGKRVSGKDLPLIGQRVCVQGLGFGHVIRYHGGFLRGTEVEVRLERPVPTWYPGGEYVTCKQSRLSW